MTAFDCKILHRDKKTRARVTRVTTPHGEFVTPTFMPVGTRAGVNNMTPKELLATESQIILGGNTYHMLLAPGIEAIKKASGMHPFMGWHGPMLTDSGGFQVFSLSKKSEICTIDEEGAHFTVPGNAPRRIHMTPEMSLETQKIIGADIIMAFDQCTPDHCDYETVRKILTRTHRWLLQSVQYQNKHPHSFYGYPQALFGIIQGGVFEDLRRESAQFITSMDTQGIAIGGETIGFNMQKTVEVIRWIYSELPEEKPRYTMGVGMSPQDLLDVVREGIDLFDCVAPTRNARHGALYCGEFVEKDEWLTFESQHENGRIHIKKHCYAHDPNPIMSNCTCYTCQHFSRARLHHLFKQKANLFTALASIHNIHVMQDTCARMRNLIIHRSSHGNH